jgi:hypothetical protein
MTNSQFQLDARTRKVRVSIHKQHVNASNPRAKQGHRISKQVNVCSLVQRSFSDDAYMFNWCVHHRHVCYVRDGVLHAW